MLAPRHIEASALFDASPYKIGIKNRLVVISFKAGFLYNNNLNILKKNQMKTFIIVFE